MSADERKTGAMALLAAGGVGAIVASLLSAHEVRAAEGGTTIDLPQDVLNALAALVADADLTTRQLADLLAALGVTKITGGNPKEIIIFTVMPTQLLFPTQFPEYFVADDKECVIRANPANAGNVTVANTAGEVINPNSSWLLQPNEWISWKIANTRQLWVATLTNLGDSVMVTAEKKP